MAMKEYSISPKAPSNVVLHHIPGHLLGEFYPSVEMQSAYSAASADWADTKMARNMFYFKLILLFQVWKITK